MSHAKEYLDDENETVDARKHLSGKGKIPSIHPDDLKWTKQEIAEYLSSGLTPSYDVAGGNMALVVENLSN